MSVPSLPPPAPHTYSYKNIYMHMHIYNDKVVKTKSTGERVGASTLRTTQVDEAYKDATVRAITTKYNYKYNYNIRRTKTLRCVRSRPSTRTLVRLILILILILRYVRITTNATITIVWALVSKQVPRLS